LTVVRGFFSASRDTITEENTVKVELLKKTSREPALFSILIVYLKAERHTVFVHLAHSSFKALITVPASG